VSELQCVKFGDIAQQITTKVNPKNTSLNTYVGLEHLDSGSLQIKRRGTPQDVIGEKLRVCKGDIIFGKRRVYQRKLAIADFDGICSAHAMVLRPKEDVVDKDFFPFFMQSDLFMERALQISVGSLSPTINWKTLAVQEFTIPLLSDQHRFAIPLWAAEDCIVKGERLLAAAERAKQVLMRELFSKGIGHTEFQQVKGFGKVTKKWDVLQLHEIITEPIKNGAFIQQNESKISVPFLNVVDVYKNSVVKISELQKINCTQSDFDKYQLRENDLLYVRSSLRRQGIAQCCMINFLPERIIFDCHLMRVRINAEKCNPKYLLYYSISDNGRKQLINISKTTTMSTLDQKDLGSFSIPIPPLPEQEQIAGILTRCDETIAAARANVTAAKALKMKMINEMLGTKPII
jgi:restriction endonuclease S subunit